MRTFMGIKWGTSYGRVTLGVLASVLGAVFFTGCAEEAIAPEDSSGHVAAAPSPPSTNSMAFDLSALQGQDGRPVAESASASAARWNWVNAVIRVTAINLILGEVLREPLEVIGLALSVDPVSMGEGVYRWRYVWSEGNEQVTIDLTGEVQTETIDWQLRLSGNVDGRTYDNALWFSGETDGEGESGFWVFSDLEESPTDVARLDWDLDQAEDRSLVFENIDRGHEDFGGQLAYRVRGDIVSLEIVEGRGGMRSTIEWDEETGVGSLTVPDYNEGQRACWDENQDDADCVDIGVAS